MPAVRTGTWIRTMTTPTRRIQKPSEEHMSKEKRKGVRLMEVQFVQEINSQNLQRNWILGSG
jgi:hypothetical protein